MRSAKELREHLTAKRGWIGIAGLVVAHEILCPPGELLSQGVDRALERQRLLTMGAIGLTALHLCNALPQAVDPFRGIDLFKG